MIVCCRVQYLGHKISAKGLQPTTEKVQAIVQVQQPANVTELKSFWAIMENFYTISSHA